MLSTFSQLSAEIEGRTYGAGVLKHEPSEAAKIKILMTEVEASKLEDTFKSIDKLLRTGLHEQARQLSDQFLLEKYSNDVKKSYSLFEQELINLQIKRMPLKNPPRKQFYASKE